MTKLFASETAVQITDEAARIFASYGLAMEYPVQRYFRDARFLLPGGGTSEILRVVIGRDLDWDRGSGVRVRRFDVLTFDCYGTLVDWERGIAEAFGAAARADGVALDRAAVLARLSRDRAARSQAERYRRYRDVLALAARAVADALGWKLGAGARDVPAREPAVVAAVPGHQRGARRGCGTPATGWRSCPTSTTISWPAPGGTWPSTSTSSSRPSRWDRTSRRRRTSSPRGSGSVRRRGCTWPRATSTTCSRRARSAFRRRGSIARRERPLDGARDRLRVPHAGRGGGAPGTKEA